MAAAHQSMNTIIHAAIRRDLARFETALREFPAGSAPRAEALMTAWANFRHQLDEHHSSEETIFWPALREVGADAALLADLGNEHERMVAALRAADAAMTTLTAAATAENAAAAGDAITELRNAVETHFSHEERDLEPVLLRNLGSAPVQRASKQVRRVQSPKQAGVFFAWLEDGAAQREREDLRATIPPPVLLVFSRLLGRSYLRDVAPVWA